MPGISRLGNGELVLVVDDEVPFRKLIGIVLSRHGYRVIEASSGPEALELVKTKGPIDLLVTDIFMAWMNGFELIGEMQLLKLRFKIVMITGHFVDYGKIADEMAFVGASVFLKKPFLQAHLLKAVDDALNGVTDA